MLQEIITKLSVLLSAFSLLLSQLGAQITPPHSPHFGAIYNPTILTSSTVSTAGALIAANNLSDLTATSTARTNIGFSGSSPVSISSTGTIVMTQANGSTNGWLSSGDWTTFNNKASSTWTQSGSIITATSSASLVQVFGISSSTQLISPSSTLPTLNGNVGIYGVASSTESRTPSSTITNLSIATTIQIPVNSTPNVSGQIAIENTSSSYFSFFDGSSLLAISPYYKCFDWTIFNASTSADYQDYITTIYNTSTLVALYPMNVGSGTMQYNLEWGPNSVTATAASHAFTATSTSNNTTSTAGGIAPTASSTLNSGDAVYFTASGSNVSSSQFGLTGICKTNP